MISSVEETGRGTSQVPKGTMDVIVWMAQAFRGLPLGRAE
jgi:hypothetical protein